MPRIGSIVVKVSDLNRAAEFWTSALGYAVRGGSVPEGESAVLKPSDAGAPSITLDTDDRMHLDLWVESEEELAAELARLVELGAQP